MPSTLVTTRYVFPGAYIGRVQTPNPVSLNQPRIPCFIGRGSRLQTIFDSGIRRSYLFRVGPLAFSVSPPYIAPLARVALNDRTIARLYKANGTPVPLNRWAFGQSAPGGAFDQVIIDPSIFDPLATYYVDYQSTDRTILDTLPFADLREIVIVGDVQGQNRYIEGRDFFIPMSYVQPTPDVANLLHQTSLFTPVVFAGAGTGTIAFGVSANYTHRYSRKYTLTVDAVAAPFVTFTWTAQSMSGQDVVETASPAVADLPLASGGFPARIIVDVTLGLEFALIDAAHGAPASLGVFLLASVVPAAFTVADTYTFYAIAPQLLELEGTFSNTNQFAQVGPFTTSLTGASTGSMLVNTNTNYTGTTNRNYVFRVTATAGVTPTRTATIKWQGFGEGIPTYGSIAIAESNPALPLTNRTVERGLKVNFIFGAVHFNPETAALAGDQFTLRVLAPRTQPTSKDSRSYIITISAAVAAAVSFTYQGSTVEAGFSTATAVGIPGQIDLPGGVKFYVRSVGDATLPVTGIDYSAGDIFTFAITDSGLINWSDQTRNVETFSTSSILTDVIGTVTGTPGARYTVLQYTPVVRTVTENVRVPALGPFTVTLRNLSLLGVAPNVTITVVIGVTTLTQVTGAPAALQFAVNPTTGVVTFNVAQAAASAVITYSAPFIDHTVIASTFAEVPFRIVPASTTSYTPYLVFTGSLPTSNFEVSYVWRGIEPDPSNFYYITANILRPISQYNSPLTAFDLDTMKRILGPANTDNDVYLAGLLALEDNVSPAAMFVQVYDADGDGFFSALDYQNAIRASETTSRLTDVTVLNGFSVLADQLDSNERMNDPFQRKDRALWVGAPIGTAIGDADTPNTLIFLAKRPMQVFGDNPAHGTRILLGNVFGTKDLQLDDGQVVSVNLDGSFIAGASSAKNASFTDPGQILLKKNIAGFSFIQTYEESEELQIGGASILYLRNIGNNVFQYNESVTVDQSSPDNNEISALNQKQFVTRDLREKMDVSLVGLVPDTVEVGVATVTSFIAGNLGLYVSRSIIAPYTDDSGNTRPIAPETDVQVFRDAVDKTLYHFRYWYNLRYGIKRLFGLYSVDRRFFSRT